MFSPVDATGAADVSAIDRSTPQELPDLSSSKAMRHKIQVPAKAQDHWGSAFLEEAGSRPVESSPDPACMGMSHDKQGLLRRQCCAQCLTTM